MGCARASGVPQLLARLAAVLGDELDAGAIRHSPRLLLVDILTFDGFFGTKFDILKPRGSASLSVQIAILKR
jgi:hypothetical protein